MGWQNLIGRSVLRLVFGLCQMKSRVEAGAGTAILAGTSDAGIFRYFQTSPEIIRLAVMIDVRFPLSLRSEEDFSHSEEDLPHSEEDLPHKRFETPRFAGGLKS